MGETKIEGTGSKSLVKAILLQTPLFRVVRTYVSVTLQLSVIRARSDRAYLGFSKMAGNSMFGQVMKFDIQFA